jgi:CubicO group peptidase (beta-lactamase class C family)
MRRWIKRLALAVLLALLPGVLPAQQDQLQGFDDYVRAALKLTGTPGVAIAVVKDDSIVFARGYGFRQMGKPGAVDERTVFAIGSETKAFTAAALAMLVDEGLIGWDDPAARHLKGFQLADPLASRELTVRDMLSHRSGLPGGDELWYGSASSRDDVLYRVRFLVPAWSFRSRFQYQNVMFIGAGEIIPAVAGKSWDAFVAERIFRPLGMTSSSTSVTALEGLPNLATPHERIGGKMRVVPYRNIDNAGPAGSINSNVLDMAQWLRLQLGAGRLGTTELIKPARFDEMHTPQTIVQRSETEAIRYADSHFLAYGLGWYLFDYHDRRVSEHAGGIDGMTADLMLVPEEKLGVVVLTNAGHNSLPWALAYRVLDAFLGRKPIDRVALFYNAFQKLDAQEDSVARLEAAGRRRGTHPTLPLDRYTGVYTDSLHESARVSLEDRKLLLRIGKTVTPWSLEHWHGDLFRGSSLDPAYVAYFGSRWVTFGLGPKGVPTVVEIQGLGRFERKQ